MARYFHPHDPVLALDRLVRERNLQFVSVDWRPINPPIAGKINGLPNMSGLAFATNGILVLIDQNGANLTGHLDFFEPADKDQSERLNEFKEPSKRSRKKKIEINYE